MEIKNLESFIIEKKKIRQKKLFSPDLKYYTKQIFALLLL